MRARLMRGKFTLLFIMLGLLLAVPAIAFAQDVTGTTTSPAPTIQSDKEDYAPGELVTLTGSGWLAGESVNIVVNDDVGQTWNRNVNVIADASGNITDQFNLPNTFVATYSVTATGANGAVATSSFTDGQLTNATITTHNATGTPPSVPCATPLTPQRTSFTSGDTVCAHVVADLTTGGQNTDWRLKWFAPGVNINSGTPARDILYTDPSSSTQVTKEDTFAVSTTGTWTLVACKTGNAGSCSPGNTVKTATFTVTKPKLTVTCNDNGRSYGDPNPTLTATITGFQGSDTQANSTTGTPSCTTTANASSPVSGSPYTITASQGTLASSKYDFTFVNGNLHVLRTPLTVNTNNQSKVYGDANPPLTGNIAGIKNGDNITASYSTTATQTSNVGSYPITATLSDPGNKLSNYFVINPGGTLTVNKKALTVTADNQSKTYGAADPTFTFSYSGFVNGDNASAIDTAPTCSVAGAHSNVGNYDITCSGGNDNNYSFNYVKGTLTVNQKVATVTAENKTKSYGDPDPSFTFQTSGVLAGDTLSGVSCGVSGAHANVGSYDITCSGNTNNNYNVNYVKGTLTVDKRELTVTADDQTKTYGDPNPNFTFTYSGGFVGTDTAADIDTAPTCTSIATASSSVAGSPYPITCSGATDNNYSFKYVDGKLTINKAPLTVTADDKSREYGDANPTFTASYSGFKNGEDLASSGVTGSPSLTTTATQSSSVAGSPYAITAAVGTLSSGNYTFSFQNGELTITKAPLTVKADNASREYGEPNPTFTASYSGFKNGQTLGTSGVTGQPSLNTNANQQSGVSGSPYTITAALGTLAANNYSFSFQNGELTITPATLTVKADNASREYGEPNPTFTASYSGFKNGQTLGTSDVTGQPSLNTNATATSSVSGSPYTITAAKGSLQSANYTFSFQNGELTITKAPLTVKADDKSKVYGDANPTLTASYSGFKNGENLGSSGVTGSPSLTTTATQSSSASGSPYTISAAVGTLASGNYSFNFVDGKLTVTKATLAVKADDATKILGAANPAFTASYSGFKNGETLATSGVTGSPSLTTNATQNSPIGPYTITAALGSLASGNYNFSFQNGTLKVIYDFTVASGAGFLQPINYTAHGITDQNVSTFKAGSTVPTKFVLKDANGNVVQAGSPPQWLTPTKGSATSQPVDETVYTEPATTGTTYQWTGSHYQYNWASPKNGSGYYWRIGVKLDDGQIHYVNISLR